MPVYSGLFECSVSKYVEEASFFVLNKESQHQVYNYLKIPGEYRLLIDILPTKKGKVDKVMFILLGVFQNFAFSK